MDVMYLRTVATRCLVAARNSFDVRAIEEFSKLAAEFTRKGGSTGAHLSSGFGHEARHSRTQSR